MNTDQTVTSENRGQRRLRIISFCLCSLNASDYQLSLINFTLVLLIAEKFNNENLYKFI